MSQCICLTELITDILLKIIVAGDGGVGKTTMLHYYLKGEFLEDEIYGSWSSLDRENLKEIYLVILDKISEFYMANHKYLEAIRLCETILEKDNCREDIYRRLMVSYFHVGQRSNALKLFHKCTKVLKYELEVKPTASTIELYRKIKESQL